MKLFAKGFNDLLEGFRLIQHPKLRVFVIIPLIINILVFIGFIWGMSAYFSGWVDAMVSWLPDWLSFLRWLVWLVFAILVGVLVFYTFVFVATLVGAPFYGLLAEQTQKLLTGKEVDEDTPWKQVIMNIPASVWREVKKFLYYLPRALGLFVVTFVLSFIPLVNLLSPVLWAVFSSWIMALEFVDYPADNNKRKIDDVIRFMRERRSRTLGFGLGVWGSTLIPIVNLVSMQAAVAGGVKFWLEEHGQLPKANPASGAGVTVR
ncbi:sulfate transporter CysZ [Hahella sp. CR1]|uniref:sulfate transporter CysZ n=1 Tax=Hahella sp. CR1 TaxID=2992807 RepID=UPI0024426A00|nr:sulfate transporter CysZ [Hahella sp. CR1]MDG9668920.1 sulfate transporter CysZ [Hahella sp. CR1]